MDLWPEMAYGFWLDMAGFMADTINTKTLIIEPEMLDIIAELDEFKGAWRALGTLAPETGRHRAAPEASPRETAPKHLGNRVKPK